MQFLDAIPLWTFFVFNVLIALFCVELGLHFGNLQRKKGNSAHTAMGSIVASVLGLLAFMVAFTFSISAARFEDRRLLVVQDANCIRASFMLADYLDEPGREAVKEMLRHYVQLRIDGLKQASTLVDTFIKSEALQHQMWSQAVFYGQKHPTYQAGSLFATSLRDLMDVNEKRVTARLHARVPEGVWYALFVVAALSLAGVGYYCGLSESGSWSARLMLVSAFSVVLLLVADLDRPGEGTIRVSQEPLEDVARQIGSPPHPLEATPDKAR